MENGKPKRVAIALFGINPNRFYDNIMVQLTRVGADYYDFKLQAMTDHVLSKYVTKKLHLLPLICYTHTINKLHLTH
jgi:hypothetical protein